MLHSEEYQLRGTAGSVLETRWFLMSSQLKDSVATFPVRTAAREAWARSTLRLLVGVFLEPGGAQKETETTVQNRVSCSVTAPAEDVPGYRETEAAGEWQKNRSSRCFLERRARSKRSVGGNRKLKSRKSGIALATCKSTTVTQIWASERRELSEPQRGGSGCPACTAPAVTS